MTVCRLNPSGPVYVIFVGLVIYLIVDGGLTMEEVLVGVLIWVGFEEDAVEGVVGVFDLLFESEQVGVQGVYRVL